MEIELKNPEEVRNYAKRLEEKSNVLSSNLDSIEWSANALSESWNNDYSSREGALLAIAEYSKALKKYVESLMKLASAVENYANNNIETAKKKA